MIPANVAPQVIFEPVGGHHRSLGSRLRLLVSICLLTMAVPIGILVLGVPLAGLVRLASMLIAMLTGGGSQG